MKQRRSNCLIASLIAYRRLGGSVFLMRPPTLKKLPGSLIPHIGIRVGDTIIHFHIDKTDPFANPIWFRGRLRRVPIAVYERWRMSQ